MIEVDLEAACTGPCQELVGRIHAQLNTAHYTRGVSILAMPPSIEWWRAAHRTARRRANRAARLGYRFAEIDRSLHTDDIYAINTSKAERQGRPMGEGYGERHEYGPLPAYVCQRHRVHTYGVLRGGTLYAYLALYRLGEFGMVSMILGHGDHMADDIMYLLAAGTIEAQLGHGGVMYYNRHDSGTAGLRYYKERIGFAAADIEFVL